MVEQFLAILNVEPVLHTGLTSKFTHPERVEKDILAKQKQLCQK